MNTAKEETIKIIENMPDDCSYSDIMAEIYFKKKVEQGLKDIEEGKTITHSELKSRMNKWKESIGH